MRPEIFQQDRTAARAKLNAGDRTVILSFGGSLGARRINEVVADLAAWEQKQPRNILHLHATGSRGVEMFKNLASEKGFSYNENLVVSEYINNMPELLAAAGSGDQPGRRARTWPSWSGGPCGYSIPSPNVAKNHQYYSR